MVFWKRISASWKPLALCKIIMILVQNGWNTRTIPWILATIPPNYSLGYLGSFLAEFCMWVKYSWGCNQRSKSPSCIESHFGPGATLCSYALGYPLREGEPHSVVVVQGKGKKLRLRRDMWVLAKTTNIYIYIYIYVYTYIFIRTIVLYIYMLYIEVRHSRTWIHT